MQDFARIKLGTYEANAAGQLGWALGVSPVLAQVLRNRGLGERQVARKWLGDGVEALHSPLLLPDMAVACQLLEEAIARHELIYVCGDYDCDGVCSVAILVEGLRALGAVAEYRVPDRFSEGFGLSSSEVDDAHLIRASIIVTVDCGSTSHEAIALAQQYGMKVIVTDHHLFDDNDVPQADAVVNAHREGSTYPFADLCGGGVAWKVVAALYERRGLPVPLELLDLVAIASIADMVPLNGENRVLASLGLQRLTKLERPGLAALAKVAKLTAGKVSARDVSFALAPRINAAGRLYSAALAVDLLLEQDPATCREKAEHIGRVNDERQALEAQLVEEVSPRLAEEFAKPNRPSLIFECGDWHPGVVGIAANKLMRRFGVPVIIGAIRGDQVVGSGRAPEDGDLHSILQRCAPLFMHFGGHTRAAGLTFALERLEEVKSAVLRAATDPSFVVLANGEVASESPADDDMSAEPEEPVTEVEFEMPLACVTVPLATDLQRLEPTGYGNKPPVFYARQVRFVNVRRVGKTGQYLMADLLQDGVSAHLRESGLEAIIAPEAQEQLMSATPTGAFWNGVADEVIAVDLQSTALDILYTVERDEFRGRVRARVVVVNVVRPRDPAVFAWAMPASLRTKLVQTPVLARLPAFADVEQARVEWPQPVTAPVAAAGATSEVAASGAEATATSAATSAPAAASAVEVQPATFLPGIIFEPHERFIDARSVLSLETYLENLAATGAVALVVNTPVQRELYSGRLGAKLCTCVLAKQLQGGSEELRSQHFVHLVLPFPPFTTAFFKADLVRQARHIHILFGAAQWRLQHTAVGRMWLDRERVAKVYLALRALLNRTAVSREKLGQHCHEIGQHFKLSRQTVGLALEVILELGAMAWSSSRAPGAANACAANASGATSGATPAANTSAANGTTSATSEATSATKASAANRVACAGNASAADDTLVCQALPQGTLKIEDSALFRRLSALGDEYSALRTAFAGGDFALNGILA